jgi:hypothetical protein
MSEKPSAARFPTTQWSRVLRAGDPSDRHGRDALEQLCRCYWYPRYAFTRRQGLDREGTGDLVQRLLADLRERGDLTGEDVDLGIRSLTEGHARPYVAGMRDRRIWRSYLVPPPTTLGSRLPDR